MSLIIVQYLKIIKFCQETELMLISFDYLTLYTNGIILIDLIIKHTNIYIYIYVGKTCKCNSNTGLKTE